MPQKSRRTDTPQAKQHRGGRTVSPSTHVDVIGAWVSLPLSKTDDTVIAHEYVARGWVASQDEILQTLSAEQRENLALLRDKTRRDEPKAAWASLPVTTARTY